MPSRRQFPAPLLAALRHGKIVRIKAGRRHRFIGIWGVVVDGRLFVRSWSIKGRSWYRTFLVDRAYLKKYGTGWELRFAKDLASPKSRATTMELTPGAGQQPHQRMKRIARGGRLKRNRSFWSAAATGCSSCAIRYAAP